MREKTDLINSVMCLKLFSHTFITQMMHTVHYQALRALCLMINRNSRVSKKNAVDNRY